MNGSHCSVTSKAKDANEALQQGVDIKALISAAVPYPHEQITTFSQILSDVRNEVLFEEQVRGIKSKFFPKLHEKLKGFRPGELTLLTGPTGVGKCLARNTPLIMCDGSVKLVQDVMPGDLLMGDDSTPRRVLTLGRGRQRMYRITQAKGESYTVNESHIISLKHSCNARMKRVDGEFVVSWIDTKGQQHAHTHSDEEAASIQFEQVVQTQQVIDIPLTEYLANSGQWKSHWKGFRVGVEFRSSSAQRFDAYEHGANAARTSDASLLQSYKTTERHVRLELLAGLIDGSQCSLLEQGVLVEIPSALQSELLFIARSCGFAAYIRGNAICIEGRLSAIPSQWLSEHKQQVIEDALLNDISIEPLEEDEYFGFQIDGNHRFLLGDFTVTHNTSFLAQYSLDFCMQGVNTLWGSFELSNVRLAKKMLVQHAKINFSKNPDKFEKAAEAFSQLPLYFLKFYGSTDVDKVLDAMDYACYVYDVGHIVLDNLQFMVSGQGHGYEKFEVQDMAVSKFRQFASAKNVSLPRLCLQLTIARFTSRL